MELINGSIGRLTYKRPSPNRQLMATFLLVAICRPHNGGIGKITIAVSMTMFKLTEVISSTVTLLQYPPGTGFQEYESGRQLVKKTQRKAMP